MPALMATLSVPRCIGMGVESRVVRPYMVIIVPCLSRGASEWTGGENEAGEKSGSACRYKPTLKAGQRERGGNQGAVQGTPGS